MAKNSGNDDLKATVVIPTRNRIDYLSTTLNSLREQELPRGWFEVVVVDDGSDGGDIEPIVAEYLDGQIEWQVIKLARRMGLNAARNAGVAAASAALVVFTDDDIDAPAGWLKAFVDAADHYQDYDAFGGPVRARLEGRQHHFCGREEAPISSLDLGPSDRDVERAWGCNFAVRSGAFERIGDFDASHTTYGGDEEMWQQLLLDRGGRIKYLADAWLWHRRSSRDSRTFALCRAAFRQGRGLRHFDQKLGKAPRLSHEIRVLLGCLWHGPRRRCANGPIMAAHSAGRIFQAAADSFGRGVSQDSQAETQLEEQILSGHSGKVAGWRRPLQAKMADKLLDLINSVMGLKRRLKRASISTPERRIDILSIYRSHEDEALIDSLRKFEDSRHQVRFFLGSLGAASERLKKHTAAENLSGGKFSNLNQILELVAASDQPADWTVIVDDDITVPESFLDHFIFLIEHFNLVLAQPALTRRSHAAWQICRRRAGSVVRETEFVEIGPLTAFSRQATAKLLPFPALEMGWGLDLHWAALAREQGWKIGIVDATPVDHSQRPQATDYSRDEAVGEAREFLSQRPFLTRDQVQKAVAVHRRW